MEKPYKAAPKIGRGSSLEPALSICKVGLKGCRRNSRIFGVLLRPTNRFALGGGGMANGTPLPRPITTLRPKLFF
jgi:hypothetical protein